MNRILFSRWTKAVLFLVCLTPVFVLSWRGWHQNLGANPIEYITHATGDWTIRFLLITLTITPLRMLLGLPRLVGFRRMLGLFAFFYGCLHLTTYLWLDKFFDVHDIVKDIAKRPFITIGFAGFVLMVPLALTSTAGWVRRLGPARWQWLHRLIYLSALAGVIHYYWLVKSDIRLPVMYGAMWAVLMVPRLAKLRLRKASDGVSLQLAAIQRQTHDAVTLRFTPPPSRPLRARPGQFFTFDWRVNGAKLPRSYSISSSPRQSGFVEITVKEQGVVSTFLNRQAAKGLKVEAHGPYGQFVFDETRHRRIALFAGGSGITPVVSILRYIEEVAPETEVALVYSFRTEQDVIFKDELERLQERLPKLRSVMVASRPGPAWQGLIGRVDKAFIEAHLGGAGNQTFFVCGPVGFMAAVKEALLSLGVPETQILQERFTIGQGAESIAASPCTVEFARSGKKVDCSSADTLLSVAEKNGIEIPASCRVGQCGTCATRVLSGEVEMEADDGLDPALRARGYRLMCVGHARGLVTLDA